MTQRDKVTDEFAVGTIPGTPYGITPFPEFVSDLGMRLLMWVYAQAGESGLSEDEAVEATRNLGLIVSAVFNGTIEDEDVPHVRLTFIERGAS